MLSQSQLFRLKYQYESLEEIIGLTPPRRIEIQLQPGKWSIKENIAHLLRYQEITIERISLILKEQGPILKRYVSETDELFPKVLIKLTPEILQELKKSRNQLENYILSIPKDEFVKNGIHPVLGSMIMTEWIEFFLLHEAHHFMTIFKLVHR